MKNALIITSQLVQDHEFIYPFYRLLEEGFELDVCLNEGTKVKGILGTDIPPNKNHEIKIAILLGFFSLELYLRIISENKISKVDSELYYYYFKVIEILYLILHRKNITSKTRIKFSDLKSIGLGSFINNFIEKLNITADTLAQKFIEKCESLKFPTSDIDTGINSYHSYVYRFFISTQQ